MDCRPLKIALMGINYAPEPTGIAPYTTGLASALAARGHEVNVFTGYPHYPDWRLATGAAPVRSVDRLDGVYVHRLRHPVPKHFSLLRRGVMELVFGLQLITSRWGSPDVVIFVTPPLLAAALGVVRARLMPHRPGVGVLVQDIYSRGIAETGVVRGLPSRLVRAVESSTMGMADGVSTIHAGFTRDLTKNLRVDPARVRENRNWTHVETADHVASRTFRNARGWTSDEVVVLHAGNMGYKQGLGNVVDAAKLADENQVPVRFVLLGDGNQREVLEKEAIGIEALEFIDTLPEVDFPAALGAADVLLVNERPGVAQMSVPSKLTSYFKAGKPVLAAVDSTGYAAEEIKAAGAGICVPAARPDLLLAHAFQLGKNRELAASLGESGRRYSMQCLSYEAAIDSYEQWIEMLASLRE